MMAANVPNAISARLKTYRGWKYLRDIAAGRSISILNRVSLPSRTRRAKCKLVVGMETYVAKENAQREQRQGG